MERRVKQVLGLEGYYGHRKGRFLSIHEECVWIDKNREGWIVELEVHRE